MRLLLLLLWIEVLQQWTKQTKRIQRKNVNRTRILGSLCVCVCVFALAAIALHGANAQVHVLCHLATISRTNEHFVCILFSLQLCNIVHMSIAATQAKWTIKRIARVFCPATLSNWMLETNNFLYPNHFPSLVLYAEPLKTGVEFLACSLIWPCVGSGDRNRAHSAPVFGQSMSLNRKHEISVLNIMSWTQSKRGLVPLFRQPGAPKHHAILRMPEKCPNSDRFRPLVAIESKNTLPNHPIELSHPNRYGDTFLINDEEERKKNPFARHFGVHWVGFRSLSWENNQLKFIFDTMGDGWSE